MNHGAHTKDFFALYGCLCILERTHCVQPQTGDTLRDFTQSMHNVRAFLHLCAQILGKLTYTSCNAGRTNKALFAL
jgi:hypothetical protein